MSSRAQASKATKKRFFTNKGKAAIFNGNYPVFATAAAMTRRVQGKPSETRLKWRGEARMMGLIVGLRDYHFTSRIFEKPMLAS
jgi:hypothetical protein